MEAPAFWDYFANLEDPRVERTRRHCLLDIIVISVLAVISGANSWEAIASYAESKQPWLGTFLSLPAGVPSAHTFRRVFGALDVTQFHLAFTEWTRALVGSLDRKLLAIDGKSLRGSYTNRAERNCLHIVSAWVAESRIVFGQVATDAKSNEITAIPRLLKMLVIAGAIVTIDAMGCQRAIVETILEREADYMIAVKDNQPTLSAEVETAFVTADINEQLPAVAVDTSSNVGHGRAETRIVTALDIPDRLSPTLIASWKGLKSIVRVESVRVLGGQESREFRYYISSLPPNAAHLASVVRGHWSIETQQHWVLDMAFDEDRARNRTGNSPENFALLRRMGLNILAKEKTSKRGVEGKRQKCGWDHKYLLKVLEAASIDLGVAD